MADFNYLSYDTYNDCGKTKTMEEVKNYKWKQIQDIRQDSFLGSKKINFELPNSFYININEYIIFPNKMNVKMQNLLMPSYNLGYIFGCFLGDGNAFIGKNNRKLRNKKTSKEFASKGSFGRISFYFGIDEKEIAEKVNKAVFDIFGLKTAMVTNRNMIIVYVWSFPLAKLFRNLFYDENTSKTFPSKFVVNDKEYLKGLLDGLIDSDGHQTYGNQQNPKYKRTKFTNTSTNLIELSGLLCYLVNGFFPSYYKKKITLGGLEGNIENCKQSYVCDWSNCFERHQTSQYQLYDKLESDEIITLTPTYDIEVSHPSHSFIANNLIVHNSICETKNKTGFFTPMFSTVLDLSTEYLMINNELIKLEKTIPIIADGGIKENGDIAKAIRAGADLVMIGGVFAECIDSPAAIQNGQKIYRGSTSFAIKQKIEHIEGKTVYLTPNMNYLEKLEDMKQSLQSAISYAGGNNLNSLKTVDFIICK